MMDNFTGSADYECHLDERHGISGGLDLLYDNRMQDRKAYDRWSTGTHAGYAFSYQKFDFKMQKGTYIGGDKKKGTFIMGPSLRYHISKIIFAQIGLKT